MTESQRQQQSSLFRRWRPFCETHLVLKAALTGLAIALPGLAIGFLIDDYVHRIMHLRTPPYGDAFPAPEYMFSFLSGFPEITEKLTGLGIYPWWTTTSIHVSFWRPLTVLTHVADYALWPNSAFLMHMHSLLWYVAVTAAAAVLFRRIESRAWIAGLAALTYAVDESHAMPAGWLANRNALIAAFFGILCLVSHDVWRKDKKLWAAPLGVAALLASLLAKEAGLAITAYLFSYAMFLDRATFRTRLLTLVPYAVTVVAWRTCYSASGYGATGSPLYIDPAFEPLRFATAMVERFPALLAGQWLNFPTEVLQTVPLAGRMAFAAVAATLLLLLFLPMRSVILASAQSRFWATGMLISLVPMCAVGAMNRVLLFAGLGGSALVATFLVFVTDAERVSSAQRWLARGFVTLHVVLAPLIFVGTLAALALAGRLVDRGVDAVEFEPGIESKTAVLVQSPTYFISLALPLKKSVDQSGAPGRFYTLSPNSLKNVAIEYERVDAFTLHATPEGGFPVLVFRTVNEPFAAGDRVELPGMAVEILEADANGKALAVAYRFDVPLEHESLVWLRMRGLRYEPFTPPAIGSSVIVK